MSGISDLERKNIFLDMEEGVSELIETLEDNDVEALNDETLLQIKEKLDIIYEVINENI